jgi:prepilin-type N-terminal cleavage/methylation domain-containing protein
MSKKGFSLLEIIAATAVFALIVTSAGGLFVSLQRAWQGQKTIIDLVQNARGAMEFMTNEIRSGRSVNVVSGDRLKFQLSINGDGTWPWQEVWYWRGDGGTYGSTSSIFRGICAVGGGLGNANNNRQELANFVVNNPSNSLFRNSGLGSYIIELTVAQNNRSYTLRTQARPRN